MNQKHTAKLVDMYKENNSDTTSKQLHSLEISMIYFNSLLEIDNLITGKSTIKKK